MNLQAYLQDAANASRKTGSKSSDVLLAVLIVSIVVLMILPLPTLLIDALVAINIAVGLMLVLMGIYISSALQFSAFPSVLLISTLFRLALSVATTRMILLHGDAGHIIDTFGSMVAGGNLVVGLVVFLIITLVQFLVIAKGAERVAEVGARFTLDAMPGKQLSIDSDLRSGLIDKHEAREKRRELELESKLHGSMDGAMKFVKGDAIAGLIIIAVNLLGGLAIGIFQLKMEASSAAAKYSILTIGDGLVAQIPALLGAMAAGLIVTRATDNLSDRHLGDSIQKQFSAKPRVLLLAGAICVLFAFVPGFPAAVFFGVGFLLLLAGGLVVPAFRARVSRLSRPSFSQVLEGQHANHAQLSPATAEQIHQAVPLLLELPRRMSNFDHTIDINERITDCVNRYQLKSGVAMPAVSIHFRREESDEWILHAFEVPIARGYIDPAAHSEDTVEAIVSEVANALRQNGTLFLGVQETGALLNIASTTYPDIVKEVQRGIPTQTIAHILRNLVQEEVPIRNMRGILESLLDAAQHEKDVHNLTEFARIGLARQTCHQYAPNGALAAIALSPQLEEQLLKHVRTSGGIQQFTMDPPSTKRLRSSIISSIDQYQPTVLLTSVQLRRHIRALIERDRFSVPVLSYNELIPTIELDLKHQLVAEEFVQLSSVK